MELERGTYVEPAKTLVAQFLEQWLDYVRPLVAPKTHEQYASIVRHNIKPAIGAVTLTKLQPIRISAAYSDALSRLAPRTVHHMHSVLSQVLKQAVQWKLLPRNPCDDCKPPKPAPRKMTVWDVSTIATALELARPWQYVPAMIAVFCGLRRGEIAALRWRHVDLDRAQLSVMESAEQTRSGVRYKEPKAARASRWHCPRWSSPNCARIVCAKPKAC